MSHHISSRDDDFLDEYELENTREAEEMLAQQEAEERDAAAAAAHQHSLNASGNKVKPRVHTLTSMSGSPEGRSEPNPNNPQALRILEMARALGIDTSAEFYLLPIAQHALESPQEWTRVSEDSETYRKERTDMEWFRELVQTERLRFRKTPSENSPWVKIKEVINNHNNNNSPTAASHPDATAANNSSSILATTSSNPHPITRTYYYNFKSFRSANSLPPTKKEIAAPSRVAKSELDIMRFTSWFMEGPNKRYIKIAYFMSAEEFEIEIVNSEKAALAHLSQTRPPLPSNDGSTAAAAAAPSAPAADDENIFRVKQIRGKHGPASCWDLHLKATLTIFGRPTTLLQCDSDTREWIETNAKRLIKVRSLLEKKLSKYEKIAETRRANIPLVETHLRSLMKDVARLKNSLAVFRPSLAEKYSL